MTAVGELMLLLGLLVTVQCAVRARDPEVEEEEEEERRGGGGVEGGDYPEGLEAPPHLRNSPHGHRPDANGPAHLLPQNADGEMSLAEEEVSPPSDEGGNYPARTGNWCAFVSRRVVTVAVACGTEKYTIKSQSPCPNGTPDCQLVMYKLSTRPVYREKQKIFTALLWRCCPGHGGQNCEETDAQSIVHQRPQDVDQDLRQSDFQMSASRLHDTQSHESHRDDNNNNTNSESVASSSYPGHAYDHHHGNNHHPPHTQPRAQPYPYNHHQGDHQGNHQGDHQGNHQGDHQGDHQGNHQGVHQGNYQGNPAMGQVKHDVEAYEDTVSPLLLAHLVSLITEQLQPVLDGFNHTLEHLTQQVGGLSREMSQLRSSQWEVDEEAMGGAGAGEGPEAFEAKLEEAFQHIEEVRRQLESHQATMEDRIHSQNVMLHYNLTSFKTDMDVKLKRNHKSLQVNLQAMNASLSDMRLEQELLGEDRQTSTQPQQSLTEFALWEAIARLDNKVLNNTAKANALVEDLELAQDNIQDLKQGFGGLVEDIRQARRDTQILFMETGLEVEAAKVVVENHLKEMSGNVTVLQKQLKELESDVDYLYPVYYKNVSDCDCKELDLAIANLRHGLANVTELANDNRLALDGNSREAGSDNWGEVGGWGPSLEDLHQGLQQVRESLAFEQERTRTLHHNVSQLLTSSLTGQRETAILRETDVRLEAQMRHLASSFSSLLKDALRHTDVLEMLLGEEVLEFMDWPKEEQEAHSIPALKQMIRHLQEQIDGQNHSEETPAADEPDDWTSRGLKRRSGDQKRDRQLSDFENHHPDYSDGDLRSLKKSLEELGHQVRQLEQRPCPATCNSSSGGVSPSSGIEANLQAEVTWLRRGLEDHLRVFKNVFSNSEGLEGSESTVDLDRLWALLRKKEGKKHRREKEGGRVDMRSRRDTSAHPKLHDNILLFLAESFSRVNEQNLMLFESTSLNHNGAYSIPSGSFKAPVEGVYLFVLTLDFKRGPTSIGLRRESGRFAVRYEKEATGLSPLTRVGLIQLEKNEMIFLELLEGTMATEYPRESFFAGLLLHQTT